MSKDREVGYVQNVYIKHENDIVEVDVSVGPNRTHNNVRFIMPARGVYSIPENEDVVEVEELRGEKIARWPYSAPEPGIPDEAVEGDLIIRLSEDSELHFEKQDDGTYNVDLTATRTTLRNKDDYGIAVEDDGTIKIYGTAIDTHTDGEVLE